MTSPNITRRNRRRWDNGRAEDKKLANSISGYLYLGLIAFFILCVSIATVVVAVNLITKHDARSYNTHAADNLTIVCGVHHPPVLDVPRLAKTFKI